MLTLQALERLPRAYRIGYQDALEQRLRPYEHGHSIAAFDWDAYEEGRKAGEMDREGVIKEILEDKGASHASRL